MGNPEPSPARARRAADRPAADGGGPPRRASRSPPAARARARRLRRAAARLPAAPATPRRRRRPARGQRAGNGAVEPRLVLRHARPAPRRPRDRGACGPTLARRRLRRARARPRRRPPSDGAPPARRRRRRGARRRPRGRPGTRARASIARGGGIAGLLGDLVAARRARARRRRADAERRARGAARPRRRLRARDLGRRSSADPGSPTRFTHVVALDPPAVAHAARARRAPAGRRAGSTWRGATAELRVRARGARVRSYDLRAAARRALPRAARPRGRARPARRSRRRSAGDGRAAARRPRSPAGCLRVLAELGLVESIASATARGRACRPAERTELERSPAFRAYAPPDARARHLATPARRHDGHGRATAVAAATPLAASGRRSYA